MRELAAVGCDSRKKESFRQNSELRFVIFKNRIVKKGKIECRARGFIRMKRVWSRKFTLSKINLKSLGILREQEQ